MISIACGLWERGHRDDIMDKPRVALVRMLPGRLAERVSVPRHRPVFTRMFVGNQTDTAIGGSPRATFRRDGSATGLLASGHRPENIPRAHIGQRRTGRKCGL